MVKGATLEEESEMSEMSSREGMSDEELFCGVPPVGKFCWYSFGIISSFG